MNESETGDARAMRLLVDEVRDAELPEVDWAKIERKLFARIDQQERVMRETRARRGPSVLAMGAAFAAAAAVIALAVSSSPNATSGAPSAVAVRARGPASVALSRGEIIDAKDGAVTFELPGAVRWTLAEGGRAVVREPGAREAAGTIVGQVIALERGAIEAEVTPLSPRDGIAEAFAVEAGATRVAVHGTSFSVTLQGDEVVVDLRHGSVAVGPAGRVGPTNGRLLLAPARAAFSLDGGSRARWLRGDEAVAVALGGADPKPETISFTHEASPEPAPIEPSAVEAARPGAVAKPATPPPQVTKQTAEPAVARPAALTVAAARAHLATCFASTYGALPAGASIVSSLSLTLRDDGSISGARFEPPLRPDFQRCAWMSGRFATERGTLRIPIAFGP